MASQGSSLLSMNFSSSDATDAGLNDLKDCTGLQASNFNYSDPISDNGMAHIIEKLFMEQHLTPINHLTETLYQWIAKLAVIEKSLIQHSRHRNTTYQRYIFTDGSDDTIQAIVYGDDTTFFNNHLQLNSTYYIGHSNIEPLIPPRSQLGSTPYQIILTSHTFVQQVENIYQLPSQNFYRFDRFTDLELFPPRDYPPITLLCLVTHAAPIQQMQIGIRQIRTQEITIINQEYHTKIKKAHKIKTFPPQLIN